MRTKPRNEVARPFSACLLAALVTSSCALVSSPGGLKIGPEEQAQIARELVGNTYHLTASMGTAEFFGEPKLLYADPRPPEIINLFNKENRKLTLPAFGEKILWAGMQVKVTKVLFPANLENRPPSQPTAHTWIELERLEDEGNPVIIVLPKDISTPAAFKHHVDDYLASKTWMDSWLMKRSSDVLDGIYAKKVLDGMSRSEMFAALGKPINADKLGNTSILEHVAEYGDLLVTLTGGVVSKVISQAAVAEAARLKAEEERKIREAEEEAERLVLEEKRRQEEEIRKAKEAEEAKIRAEREAKEAEERRQREEEAQRLAEIERQKKEQERERITEEQRKRREEEQARIDQERLAREKAELEKAAQDKAAKDEAEREKATAQRAAQEKAEREKAVAQQEQAAREKADREQRERAERQREQTAPEKKAAAAPEREPARPVAEPDKARVKPEPEPKAQGRLENTSATPPTDEEIQRAEAEIEAKRKAISQSIAKAEAAIRKDESRYSRPVEKAQAQHARIEKMMAAALTKVDDAVVASAQTLEEAKVAQPVAGSKGRNLGLTLEDVTPLLARELNLETTDGAHVLDVRAEGKESGFRAGDIVHKLNDQTIKDSSALKAAAAEAPLDKPVYVELARSGKLEVIILSEVGVVDEKKVAAAQAKLDRAETQARDARALWQTEIGKAQGKLDEATTALEKKLAPSRDQLYQAQCELAELEGRPRPSPVLTRSNQRKLGLRLGNVPGEQLEKQRLAGGALIVEVNGGGLGAAAGARPDDIVVSFDGKPVKDAGELAAFAGAAPKDRPVPFEVVRRGHVVRLTLPADGATAGEPTGEVERGPVAPARGPVRGPVVPKKP